MKNPLAVTILFAAVASLPAQNEPTGKTLVTIAVEAGQFTTLVKAVQAAGLVDTLSGKGPFTIFAPTDAAFAKLGEKTLKELLEPQNKARLTAILTYHVVGEALPATKVVATKELTSLQGSPLAIVADKTGVKVAGAKVAKTDVFGSNGVIHVLDEVMLPPADLVATAQKAGAFGTLLKAAVAAGLADTLANGGPFTVFAPTDAAFAKLGDATIAELLQPANKERLTAILKHHVVAGRVPAAQAVKLDRAKTIGGTELQLAVHGKTLTVGGANVTQADVIAGNGVIHVIDAVLLPQN